MELEHVVLHQISVHVDGIVRHEVEVQRRVDGENIVVREQVAVVQQV